MIIEFSFNYKILFILIFPISTQFEPFIIKLYMREENILFELFHVFLSNLFFIIFMIIFNERTKKERKQQNSESSIGVNDNPNIEMLGQIQKEILKEKSKKFRRNILILIGLSVLIFLADFINIYFTNDNNIRFFYNTVGALFEIINFCLLNIFIFRQKFYRHHIISFIIISISLIILFIIYAIGNKFNLHIILYFYLYSLFYSLFFFVERNI